MTRTDKFGDPPTHGSPLEDFAAYIADGYGLPDGYRVAQVVRYGGRSGTGLTVFIAPPGTGDALRVDYERESDCWNHNTLVARAIGDTRGLVDGGRINSARAARAMYRALCSMADHFEAAGSADQAWEWVQSLERVAAVTSGRIDSYQSLKRLQMHDYTKQSIQDPPLAGRVRPLVLVDERTDDTYITARQMAVFLRHDLGAEDVGSDDQIVSRLKQIGGERVRAERWDRGGRDRTEKVVLVLYRLPRDDPQTGDVS